MYATLHRATIAATALVVAAAITLPAAPALAQKFCNPLSPSCSSSTGGAATFGAIIDKMKDFLFAIGVPLVFLAIVYGGVTIILGSFGDQKLVSRGKSIITWSLVGLSILLAPLLIADTVASFLGVTPRGDPLTRRNGVLDIITNIVNVFLGMGSVLALAAVIYGGVLISASLGDEGRARQGKQAVTYGLTGLIVIMLSFALIWTVRNIFI